MSVERFVRKGKGVLRRAAARARRLDPRALARDYRLSRWRERTERYLSDFSRSGLGRFEGRVLVDAMWDNPNYWIRYALFRAALGLAGSREVGVLGPYRAALCRRTLERFGVAEIAHTPSLMGDEGVHRREAARLLAGTRGPEDILRWQLPHDLPPDFVYDGILKRQRSACVDLKDPRLVDHVAEALGSIVAAERLLDRHRFDLVLLSHGVNFQFAALAWLAAQRRVPVVLLYGNYGVARLAKVIRPQDIYETTDRPEPADLEALPVERAGALARVGREYLEKRRAGRTDDIGARYAFQKREKAVDRRTLLERFGWDPTCPIMAVYASNWFDFPHPCGMSHFRDFLDWLEATVRVANENDAVNWLFRAHPCDEWYGGVTLRDLMPESPQRHVRLAEEDWNGSALMDSVDGLVTYHGTAGVEYAAAGKPVLLSDRGWYHDVGLAKWPKSREEYLDALTREWWKELDIEEATRRAQIFAGWYFGRPAWQGNFVVQDDTVQAPIYEKAARLFEENPGAVARDVSTIREWFYSDSRHYHTYKMKQAAEFTY